MHKKRLDLEGFFGLRSIILYLYSRDRENVGFAS